jgi:hypothetical protein
MGFITISHVVTTITIYAVTRLHSLQSVHTIFRSFHVFSLTLHLHIFTLRNLPANWSERRRIRLETELLVKSKSHYDWRSVSQ